MINMKSPAYEIVITMSWMNVLSTQDTAQLNKRHSRLG